jgi:hypothetical protein
MRPSLRLALIVLLLGPGAALAQYRPYTPPAPPVPYTPPTVYAPPRAFEHAQPPPIAIPPPVVVVPGEEGDHRPVVVLPPPAPPPPPGPMPDAADQVIQELGECLAHGTTQLVDCLRQNHDSVTIRRLEACLRSESIPEDARDVRACLAAGRW